MEKACAEKADTGRGVIGFRTVPSNKKLFSQAIRRRTAAKPAEIPFAGFFMGVNAFESGHTAHTWPVPDFPAENNAADSREITGTGYRSGAAA